MKSKSFAMDMCSRLGMESLAWPLRRLHCPVDKDALVLEVGSGGNPYARANILLDAYEETRERHWAPLVADRPTVLGFGEKLPFKDKAFDFVIASHVLEHSTDPATFLGELQRVAKAGYIEVPDAFMERVNPYRDHRLEITMRNGALRIRKKKAWMEQPETVELYEDRAKTLVAGGLIPRHPFAFHVRYYWENEISFEIVNPETDAAWEPPVSRQENGAIVAGFRGKLQSFIRKLGSQTERNRSLDVFQYLQCPCCQSDALAAAGESVRCQNCQAEYQLRNGVPVMSAGLPR